MKREFWKNRLGFVFAALGSAVGLGSIWRFPYIVGENGGAAFILLYIFCLALIGFPVLIAEIVIGRATHKNPSGAFAQLGKRSFWKKSGKLTIITGFLVSSFYSVIGGWTLGYLIESILGKLYFVNPLESSEHFHYVSSSAYWSLGFHFLFLLICTLVLLIGVRKGIELGSKIMMPLLMMVLVVITIKGLTLPNAFKGVEFLFSPRWDLLTPSAFAIALGQAFFTLSLGQGTMVTYGSYLSKREAIFGSCFPVVILNTLIGLIVGVGIFSIVFSVGFSPGSGPSLIFETLPIVFSQLPWGKSISILFFLLVVIAAITSEISALEPTISYLIDEKKFSRKKATLITVIGALLLGIPSALSFSIAKDITLYGATFYDLISTISVNFLIPLGGALAVILVGWKWGMKSAFDNFSGGSSNFQITRPYLAKYFYISIKYFSPVLIFLILLNLLGIY